VSELAISILYKLISNLIGFVLIILGFILIKKQLNRNESNLALSYAGAKLSLKNAPAGIMFALFGAVIIFVTIFKGIEIKSHSLSKNNKFNDNPIVVDTTRLPDSISLNKAEAITDKIEYPDVDSLYHLAQDNIVNKQYLASLKYLYFIKGILIFEKKSIVFNKNINKNINSSEVQLNQILNNRPNESSETRSIKINDDDKDSIR
jgi:hypothetical protein